METKQAAFGLPSLPGRFLEGDLSARRLPLFFRFDLHSEEGAVEKAVEGAEGAA